jgi:hypothetical protein
LLSERNYLRKAHEVHATALGRAGAKSVAPVGSGTLVARVARGFANAGVTFNQEAVSKMIHKELQELRKMPYLSDIGRETAEKAERLFACLNSRFVKSRNRNGVLRARARIVALRLSTFASGRSTEPLGGLAGSSTPKL